MTIYVDGAAVASVYADVSSGAWQWAYPGDRELDDGRHEFTVIARDPAGNTTSASEPFVVTRGHSQGFESFTPGVIANGTDLGLFTLASRNGAKIEILPLGNFGFTDNLILLGDAGRTTDDYIFTLAKPAKSISFSLGGNEEVNTTFIRFYDINGVLLYDEELPVRSTKDQRFTFEADGDTLIGRFEIILINEIWGIAIDDISLVFAPSDAVASFAAPAVAGYEIETEDALILNAAIEAYRLNFDRLDQQPLTLSVYSVLSHGQEDVFISNNNIQLMVEGEVNTNITLTDIMADGSDSGDWNKSEDVTIAGVQYTSYAHSGAEIEVFVQQEIIVNLDNH